MSDTPITRHAFNEAEKLSTFAHQRRFLFDKMEIMERENAKLREVLAELDRIVADVRQREAPDSPLRKLYTAALGRSAALIAQRS